MFKRTDGRIRTLVDYPDSRQVFQSVDVPAGRNLLLPLGQDNPGACNVIEFQRGQESTRTVRPLLEAGAEVFVRSNRDYQS